jgi:hypothetical protein
MLMMKKINKVLLLTGLLMFAQGCSKNATEVLLDEMEAIAKQKSVIEAKLKSNTPGAEKELEKLSEIAQSFRKRIETAKEKGFSKTQSERFMKILSDTDTE